MIWAVMGSALCGFVLGAITWGTFQYYRGYDDAIDSMRKYK